jgi:glycerophosphoryl diester phosphodiesterase
MKKNLDWLKTSLIAHRGLHQKDQSVPENSLLACQLALDNGYAIEIDVNMLKDGTVVVFHDDDLVRMCGIDQKLSNLNHQDIKDIKLKNSLETIPTLAQVLHLVSGRMPLLIELKPKGDVIKLSSACHQVLKDYVGTYAIFSFHPKVVWWFKKNDPKTIRGQISSYFLDEDLSNIKKFIMKRMYFNRWTKPDFISYDINHLPNKYLDRAFKKGLTVISFAAQSQDALDRVKSFYDNAVFEHFIPKP